MPLAEGFYGTNADATENAEFCKLCFENGAFVEPNLTLKEMIGKSIRQMTRHLKMDDDQAEVLANAVIPTLKRWQ
jgi:hypothetical protein